MSLFDFRGVRSNVTLCSWTHFHTNRSMRLACRRERVIQQRIEQVRDFSLPVPLGTTVCGHLEISLAAFRSFETVIFRTMARKYIGFVVIAHRAFCTCLKRFVSCGQILSAVAIPVSRPTETRRTLALRLCVVGYMTPSERISYYQCVFIS